MVLDLLTGICIFYTKSNVLFLLDKREFIVTIKYVLHSREVFLIENPSAFSISGGDLFE